MEFVELSISKANYNACIKNDRSFLIADNKEISLQKGDRVTHFEQDVGKPDTGRWFVAVVKFITNHEQKRNFVVYQFEIETEGMDEETLIHH